MNDKKHITLTYLNIRESITILLTKLIFIDLMLAALALLYYFLILEGERFVAGISSNITLFLVVFTVIAVFKMTMTCYVILDWLNEYYEITPEHIIHKHGIIFRKTEHYRLNNVRAMKIKDSLLGEMFNFATITLYDIRLIKYLDMYLVHNARRYAKILKEIRPQIEMKEDHVWLPMKKDDEILPKEKY